MNLPEPDIDRILNAVGPVQKLAYAATNVYPMAAPAFESAPLAERTRPTPGPLRLYVHIPFCNYACNFCFFAIKIGARREQMERYVEALARELEWIEPGNSVSQLFVGGGTPTALPSDLLDQMLGSVFSRVASSGDGVHTVETSPESITADHLAVLKARGIGRVSMGIQSLDDGVLNDVQRRHTAAEALAACRLIADSGVILNVDLIYGLPGQSEKSFANDVRSLADAGVHSLTMYNLRVNEGTPVARVVREEERLSTERLMRWRRFVRQTARDLGYTQTRWHTFKRLDGVAASHNRLPCFDDKREGGFQLGVGMSARSHLGHSIFRNHKNFEVYLERIAAGQSPVEEVFPLTEEDQKTQFVARSLGDGKPLNRAAYIEAFNCAVEDDYGALLDRLHDAELVEEHEEGIVLSNTGQLIFDLITIAFYPAKAHEWLEGRADHELGRTRSLAP